MVSNGPLARENEFPKTGLETGGKSSGQGVNKSEDSGEVRNEVPAMMAAVML